MTTLAERLELAMKGPPVVRPIDLARACDITQPSVSDWLNGKTKKMEGANLLAASKLLRVNAQWLATGKGPMRSQNSPEHTEVELVDDEIITVPVMNAKGSMGRGVSLPEHDAVIDRITLSKAWVRTNLVVSAPNQLAIISGLGNSMDPTFRDGDLLLVDRGITTVTIDAIYVFCSGGDLFIKTLQRRPNGALRAISDNKTYDSWDIDTTDETFQCLGRIVWAWNGKKL